VLCPSSTGRHEGDVQIIGFIGPDGRVANLADPIPFTPEVREAAGPEPERKFRLSAPCSEAKCRNWENSACNLVDRLRAHVGAALPEVARHQAGTRLAACAIRTDCRWWRQHGPDACTICPVVVYNPSAP
jgi:hypothetical protein